MCLEEVGVKAPDPDLTVLADEDPVRLVVGHETGVGSYPIHVGDSASELRACSGLTTGLAMDGWMDGWIEER